MLIRRQRLFALLTQFAILSLLCLGGLSPARAAVGLVSFTATGAPDQIIVVWETATEIGISGFYIWRNTSETGDYTRVSNLIEPQGDQVAGWVYTWVDEDVVNGVTYWYKLEAVEAVSEFFGPVSATAGVQQPTATMTATPTSTQDLTQTATATATQDGIQTATATATNIFDPTITASPTSFAPGSTNTPSTAYPAPVATTPSIPPAVQAATPTAPLLPSTPTLFASNLATPSPGPTQVVSATITLLPFPELTLTFPEGGILLPGRATPTPTPVQVAPVSGPGWFPTGGILLVVVLVIIWSLLGAWFYLSFQRLQ